MQSSDIILVILPVILMFSQVGGLSRTKRVALVYPPNGSKTQLIVGFGFPLTVDYHSLTMGLVLKYNYFVATNASEIIGDYVVLQRGKTRWNFYSLIGDFVSRLGVDGRKCVLRAICESAEMPFKKNGLAEELLHILLSPSSTAEDYHLPERDFHAAERHGAKGSGCDSYRKHCDFDLLSFMSKIS